MEETLYDNNHNSLKEYIMPSSNSIIKVVFATHLLSLVKNIVKSSIMAVYKSFVEGKEKKSDSIQSVRSVIRDGNIIFETAIKYLNQSWVDYHNNSDEILRKKIDLMTKNGKFLHTSCLFSYFWEFIQIFLIYTLGRIDVSELRDSEFLSECVDIITDGIMAFHVDTINNREYFCDENCEVLLFEENKEFIKIKRNN
jgi:hypothetical protein